MPIRRPTSLVLVALAAVLALTIGALAPGSAMTASPKPAKPQPAEVTWKGYDEVRFGISIKKASKLLKGKPMTVCARQLTYIAQRDYSGVSADNGFTGQKKALRFLSFDDDVRFPRGVHAGMKKASAVKKLPKRGVEADGSRSFRLKVGPQGRVLWAAFSRGSTSAYAVGITSSLKHFIAHGARESCGGA